MDSIFGGDSVTPSGISSIYSLLISGPMTLGYAMFAISIFRKRATSAAEVFYGFERFGKAFGLYIVTSIFILLWAVLLIVPGIIAAIRYSMSFYILADNPEIGIMEAIAESKRMMQGNKWKFFCLNLSFIGWIILSCFTLGIGLLWLLPYMEVSIVAFYDITNGSLRAAKHIEGEGGFRGETPAEGIDPITVYKEEPFLEEPAKLEMQEATPEVQETPEESEKTEEEKNEE